MPGQAAGGNQGFIAPMLATAAAGLPTDADEFVAEVKWDGLRACVAVSGGRVRAWSRSGRDITAVYPELGALAAVAGRRTHVQVSPPRYIAWRLFSARTRICCKLPRGCTISATHPTLL